MKNFVSILSGLLMALSLTACAQQTHYHGDGLFSGKRVVASKNYVTKKISVDNFDGLSVAGSYDVVVTQRPGKPKVEVYTSDNIVDLLDIKVQGGVLRVGFKKGYNLSYDRLEVRIWAEELNTIALAGSGDVDLSNGLKADNLNISVAGSGDITGAGLECGTLQVSVAGSGDVNMNRVVCDALKSSVSGSGDMKLVDITVSQVKTSIAGSGTVTLTGTADEADFSVAGSGDLYAQNMKTKRVSSSVAGSGNIKCHATDYLKVRTSGSGSVGYKGDPELDVPKKNLYKL